MDGDLVPPACHNQPQTQGHMVLMSQPEGTFSLPGKTHSQRLCGAPGSYSHQFPLPAAQSFRFPAQLQLGAAASSFDAPPSPRWFIYRMTHRLLMLLMESSDATFKSQLGKGGGTHPGSQLPEIQGDAASSQSMLHGQPKTRRRW